MDMLEDGGAGLVIGLTWGAGWAGWGPAWGAVTAGLVGWEPAGGWAIPPAAAGALQELFRWDM